MAISVYNLMSDLQATSIAGKVSFSQYLEKLQARTSRELQSKYVDAFNENNEKLNSYLNLTSGNPSNNLFKAVRKSDPRQIGGLSHDMDAYKLHIKGLDSCLLSSVLPIRWRC
jgi:hypothetical protein